jgi:competence protein ComFC
MREKPWWHQARSILLDLVFPPHCQGCRAPGAWFCPRCVALLRTFQPPLCERCGRETADACASCQAHPLPASLLGLRAVAQFDGPLRRAIHALKYEQVTVLAEPFGLLLTDYLAAHPLPITLIVPVPLHAEREVERGYNQSKLLASVVSRASAIPMDAGAIVRARNTLPQVGLAEKARRTNLVGAFVCPRPLNGQRVLVVDDVSTTGATMSECALALSAAGAHSVWGLTLAQ